MPHILTIMHVVPGREDLFEDFYRKRKVQFVRDNVPGLIDYSVFRIAERANREGPRELPYQFAAVIEVRDVATAMDYFYSPEYREFLAEYAPLFQPEAHGGGLYVAVPVEAEGLQSKEEFWKDRRPVAVG